MTEHETPHPGGHVVVCGLHGVGLRVVEQLMASGVPAVVVDDRPDPRLVGTVEAWGIRHLVGDPREAATLREAGVAVARALVCAETDDLVTLATALTARRMRADLAVVVQMRNPAVGRALDDLDVTVIDVARLSAPSIVEACLATGAHVIDLDGEEFVLARVPVPRATTLRDLYGDLAPVAVARHGEDDVVVCPGRDLRVTAGDVVTLFGTRAEIVREGVSHERVRDAVAASGGVGARHPRPERAQGRGGAHPWSWLGTAAGALDRRIWTVVAVLAALMATSTAVLLSGYVEPDGTRMTLVDAVYFTVETMATVGYGDFYFRDQQTWLRLFAVALMISGATTVTVFFALLTNALISRQLDEALGRGRIRRLRHHVVVVGLGSIGVEVVGALRRAGAPVVVVESDGANRYLPQVRAWGVPLVVSDATQERTLDLVQAAAARAVAVTTSDDLTNLEIGLAVRGRTGTGGRDVPVVMRLFDRDLAVSVRHAFGFRHVRSTAALAAPWFVGAALGLGVLGTFYAAGRPLLLARLTVRAGGGLDGVALQDLDAQARVLAIARGGTLDHSPRRDSRLSGGDLAYVAGPYEELLRMLRLGEERRDRPGATA